MADILDDLRDRRLDAVISATNAPQMMSRALRRLSDSAIKELFYALVADIDERMLAEKSDRSQS